MYTREQRFSASHEGLLQSMQQSSGVLQASKTFCKSCSRAETFASDAGSSTNGAEPSANYTHTQSSLQAMQSLLLQKASAYLYSLQKTVRCCTRALNICTAASLLRSLHGLQLSLRRLQRFCVVCIACRRLCFQCKERRGRDRRRRSEADDATKQRTQELTDVESLLQTI